MARETNLKSLGFNFPTAHITKMCRDLKAAGYTVERDNEAGTVVARVVLFSKADPDGTLTVVVRAMQMGRRGPWLLRADPLVMTAE